MHAFADRGRPIMDQGPTSARVLLERDVWIGAGAIVLPGVTIGTGAVVGAGSVVTRSVPPYTVVAGTPAVTLRER